MSYDSTLFKEGFLSVIYMLSGGSSDIYLGALLRMDASL